MKKACLFVLLLVVSAMPSLAQDNKVDIFGGYSFVDSGPGLGLTSGNASGWEGALTYNWNKRWSLKGDFDGHYCCDQTMHNFLFGPQINFGGDKVKPFVHGLVGASHGTSPGFSDTVLGFALGGGLDIKWTGRISVRLIQADYLGTRYLDFTQNNFRLSGGLVFHFGRK